MADKIDSLKIGSTSYDIDLPPDATPSIASLTTSGAVTANGGTTTNGLVVKNSTGQTATFTVTNAYDNVGSLSLSGVDYLSASNVQATFGTVSCGTAYITQLGDSDMFTYTYLDQNFVFKTNESGESGRGQATYGVKIPNTYGWTANRTLATTNDIPTVNNGTLTIQKNGTNVQTFTANQSGNATANITVPTKTSDITNDSGFLTSHQSIKTLKTDNTTAQSTSSSEAIAGSGTINLHKVSKTGSYNDLLDKPTIPTNTNQTVKGNGTAFSANDAIDIVGAGTVTVTADTTNKKITITGSAHTTDHNQTVKGNGFAFGADSAVNFVGKDGITVAVDGSVNNQINISGSYPTKTLKTDNTTAQTTSSSEAIAGSGTINLHKVAKTGTYSDLIGTPTIPTTYLKSASVSSNTLTLTPASGTATTFTPYNQTVAADGTLFGANREINFVGKNGITVAADGSIANQINISGSYPTPEIIDISDGITQAIKNKVAAKPLSFLQDADGYLYYPSYFSSSDGIPNCYESFDTESCESKMLSINWTSLTADTSTETYATNNSVQSKTYIHNLTITPTSTSQAHTLYLKIINRTSTALTKTALLTLSKGNALQPRTVECGILNASNNFYPARLVSTSYSGAAPTFTILVNGQSSTWTLTLSTVTDDFVQL